MTLYRVTTPRGNTTSTGLTLAEATELAKELGDWAKVSSMPGCLTITRLEGESLMIGNQIEVVVVKIRGSRVQLRIVAPRDMSIKQMELMPKHE